MPTAKSRSSSKKSRFGVVAAQRNGELTAGYTWQGERHSVPGVSRTENEAWSALAAIETDLKCGDFVAQQKGSVTFAVFDAEVAEIRKNELKIGTRANNASYLRRQLNPTFGSKPLNKISVRMVDRW